MKAITLAQFGDETNFKLQETAVPKIKGDEVLIQIKASAFNPIDYQMRKGLRESQLMVGSVLGIEFAGIIVEMGPEVQGFKIGDGVVGVSVHKGSNGSYAQYMALSYKELVHKPENISFETAASIAVSGTTAWLCYNRMNSRQDDSIFINGASGGVGRFLILLLLHYKIGNIVVTAGSPESINVLKNLGIPPENIINYHRPDLEDKILEANGGNKFEHAVDLVGGTISEITAQVLKVNGNYLDVTFLSTENAREILFDNACTVLNIAAYAEITDNSELRKITELITDQKILVPEINIIGDLSVETVRTAHRLMESNKTYGAKLIMSI